MRVLLLVCFLLLLNCEDKKSETKKVAKPTIEATSNTEKKDSVTNTNEREFPKLDNKNAMLFFLEYEKENKENKVRMTTDFGEIDILLFDNTKFHRANFIFLTKQKYFENTQFYRVIDNFIVQAGNSDNRAISRKRTDIGRYLLPTDTKKGYTHDRGVISMPSSEIDNPHKLASPFEFFIVSQRGGAKFLDGDYTIFGKVIRGMDVVDKIAAVDTDEADWPLQNIYIRKVEIIE
ncbi:peptidylprolyl isomerase [Flavobacteriaceae bacterium S0825]|uniref:peptidylprolyl isomerase n=1 Tax=Gaetbulibacter sp. S0825 TaxID=2720084 RepID=UPI00143053FF|nr:peptidylprolyl isomerase [Gaetbulibacter sp. S0825]MCK0110056.1 peptidylprolyl isomerase [Flavobacteriaceae bacterium S0825]NIX65685.1 peptidylprolyl isomerase [Gaetbulibacter sp. S0825]